MSKISAYTALTVPAGADVLPVVDVSDTSMAASGTTKKITIANLAAVDWLNVVTQFGADPSGVADSTTAIQNALNAVPANGGVVYLPAGTYKVSGTVTNTVTPTYITGDGRWATTISFTGTGDCIRMYNPSGSGTGVGGGVTGLTIDGTGAGNSSAGLHIGDGSNYQLDCVAQDFTGTGSTGFHFDNTLWWCEKIHGIIYASNNTSNVVFDVSGATTSTISFGYCDLQIWVNALANQDGVVLQNGAQIYHAALAIRGNFANSGSAQSSAVLRLTGTAPAGHLQAGQGSQIVRCRLDVTVECAAGSHGPTTIVLGNVSAGTVIEGCYGVIDFGGGPGNFAAFTSPLSSVANAIWYEGVVNGDVNLNPAGSVQPVVLGGKVYSSSFASGGSGSVFVASGDFFKATLSASITVNLNASTNAAAPRRVTIVYKQAAAGGPFTVTWPHSGSPTSSSPTVLWAGGTAPTMTAAANAVDVYKLETTDGATWYGQALQNVS